MVRGQIRPAMAGQPRVAASVVTARRVWAAVLWMIGIFAIPAIIVAASQGEKVLAIIIGLIAGAIITGSLA